MNTTNKVVKKMLILNQHQSSNIIAEGLAIDPETETIYISFWRGCRIVVYNKEMNEQKFPNNKFKVKYPRGLRFKHRMLYVTESGRKLLHSCIKVFQRNGTLLVKFGVWGGHESQFRNPLALDVDYHKNMYICDANNETIKVFSKEGKFISKFGKGNLHWPIDIRIHETLIYVLDYTKLRMLVFDFEHNFVTKFGFPQNVMPSYFVINSYGELILTLERSINLMKVNEHNSLILEYPHEYTYDNTGRSGIGMDSKERIISAFRTQGSTFLQVIEDP